MCGRFTLRANLNLLLQQFAIHQSELDQWTPRYNIAPTQNVLAVRCDDRGQRELTSLRWGLIPPWSKDIKIGSRMINARAETVAEKPSFRSPFKRKRCLILADGFYEWKKTGASKQPYHITLEGEPPFAFAGLWERWKTADQPAIESCTIITTEPNLVMADIHNRMPVILTDSDIDQWLDNECDDPQSLLPLLDSYPASAMRCTAVETRINSPRNDSADCLKKIQDV